MTTASSAHPGILHKYTTRLVAFEHWFPNPYSVPINTLIFIGGLFDGLLTVPFTPPLSAALPTSWSLAQPILSSSYTGFGTSSLDKDVQEISQCVAYFRNLKPGGKIVLMGHSTGSQDVMHYLVSAEPPAEKEQEQEQEKSTGRPKIDGGILQSSVSDREAFVMCPPASYTKACTVAQEMVAEGRAEDILPRDATDGHMGGILSARRWLSLASPPPEYSGQDDYFSSDLPDSRLQSTFSKLASSGTRISFLFAGKDQFVPAHVDKVALVTKWEGIVRDAGGVVDEGSGIVEGADHALFQVEEGVVEDLVQRVVGFLERVGGKEVGVKVKTVEVEGKEGEVEKEVEKEVEGKEVDGKEVDGKEVEGKEVEGKEVEGKEAEGKDVEAEWKDVDVKQKEVAPLEGVVGREKEEL
ncbi:MAG: hypothetical protein MMC33_000544 [Icmadophila ericetorum]|nr:hypothetical protein [Icmadophila ericetorum]